MPDDCAGPTGHHPASWRTDKQSSTAHGYGYKWRQARAGYLVLHPFCAYCLREVGVSYDQEAVTIGLQCTKAGIGLPYAQAVDHVTPHRGDMKVFWDLANWQSLCSTHHSLDIRLLGGRQRQRVHY